MRLGVCAGLLYLAMLMTVVNVAPKPDFGWLEAILVQVLHTFALCLAV